MCDSPRICPSLLEYTPPLSTTIILCDPSRIDPSLPEYTPPFSTTIILCDPPRIYPSLPEYTTPLFNKCICLTLQNLPLPPRIYPLFNSSMRPSQNLLLPPRLYPFQQMYIMCDPPRIYLFLPGYTPPPFNNYMRPSQNIPFPLRIYPPFSTNVYVRPSQNIPLPPSQNTPPFSTTKSTPPSQNIFPPPFQQLYMTLPEYSRPSRNIPTFQQLYYYTTLPESIPPSISPRIYPPPLSTTICDTHRNYPFLGEHPPPLFRQLYAPYPLRIYPSSPFYNYIPRT